jgi:hypothetical protein
MKYIQPLNNGILITAVGTNNYSSRHETDRKQLNRWTKTAFALQDQLWSRSNITSEGDIIDKIKLFVYLIK